MAHIQGEKELVDLLQHPAVKPHINYAIFQGISGGTQIDYALHIVETAIQANPHNQELTTRYDHFKSLNTSRYGPRVTIDYSQPKNPSYSARRCTEPINPFS